MVGEPTRMEVHMTERATAAHGSGTAVGEDAAQAEQWQRTIQELSALRLAVQERILTAMAECAGDMHGQPPLEREELSRAIRALSEASQQLGY